ncbi:hypothetical protein [Macrococcoides caseolyticum]|uniref:hypothetical protein n=1 Tax=Macrococcoides caseolyticum TaxID=69966 RepID=UPI001C5D480C|nr:hypothetical protein [Macrococcus caseolyticus]QYA35003.1 hypothetical protein KYI08_10140 [Macrococcus caseolyticus]
MGIKLNKFINENNKKLSNETIRQHLIDILNIKYNNKEKEYYSVKLDENTVESPQPIITSSQLIMTRSSYKSKSIKIISHKKTDLSFNKSMFTSKGKQGLVA